MRAFARIQSPVGGLTDIDLFAIVSVLRPGHVYADVMLASRDKLKKMEAILSFGKGRGFAYQN